MDKSIDIYKFQRLTLQQKIDLYSQGYSLPESLALENVSTTQYMTAGLAAYGTYWSYKNKHNILAIILGAVTISSISGIYVNLNK